MNLKTSSAKVRAFWHPCKCFLKIFHNLLIKFNIALILDPFSVPFSAYFVHFRPVSPPRLRRCKITPNSLFIAYYKFSLSIFAVLLFPEIENSPTHPSENEFI